ncbi:UDP-glycosyltransferase 89A2 [Acorus calamus]|uniref:UDP-glycosyltransferase 89A2 n=1 Tax=Acorus calamus TaxID=4465 RepID=A0AAV9E2P0_ACOCL|nr:UDP-glycosyltransferase 89A2 [Acorus calamus]
MCQRLRTTAMATAVLGDNDSRRQRDDVDATPKRVSNSMTTIIGSTTPTTRSEADDSIGGDFDNSFKMGSMPSPPPHAVFIPYLAQGHVIPLRELSHRLVDRGFFLIYNLIFN